MPSTAVSTVTDESVLVARLMAGEAGAFALLYDRYAAMMLGIILNIVPEMADAENLLQDAFVKVWRFIQSYDATKGRLGTWLLNIARNTAIDFLRSRAYAQKKAMMKLDDVVKSDAEPSGNVAKEDAIGLWELVQKMSKPHREVIHWMYFEGFTQQEIAERFGLPLGTVKTRMRMALRELRQSYDLL